MISDWLSPNPIHIAETLATIMKNQILILLLFAIFSCKENQPKENLESKVDLTVKIAPQKTDSLYKVELKNLLDESYQKGSIDSVQLFLMKWKTESDAIKPIINDSLTSNLYQIFYEIYNPFELEKYGWMKREHFKNYKYAITPSYLPYVYGTKVDTLKNFNPKNKFKNAAVLNSIPLFDNVMTDFLKVDKEKKEWFLRDVLLMPVTYRNIDFRTSPEINNITINEQMNTASAEIRLISTGLELKLKKVDDKWSIINIKELWIE